MQATNHEKRMASTRCEQFWTCKANFFSTTRRKARLLAHYIYITEYLLWSNTLLTCGIDDQLGVRGEMWKCVLVSVCPIKTMSFVHRYCGGAHD